MNTSSLQRHRLETSVKILIFYPLSYQYSFRNVVTEERVRTKTGVEYGRSYWSRGTSKKSDRYQLILRKSETEIRPKIIGHSHLLSEHFYILKYFSYLVISRNFFSTTPDIILRTSSFNLTLNSLSLHSVTRRYELSPTGFYLSGVSTSPHAHTRVYTLHLL